MNNNVIFTRTDKGNIIMALDDKMYVSKVTEMLQDTETYEMYKLKEISQRKLLLQVCGECL